MHGCTFVNVKPTMMYIFIFYLVAIGIGSIFGDLDLVKVVLVELTDKTGEIVVLKVFGEDGLGKLARLLDYKRLAVLTPTDNQIMLLLLKHSIVFNKINGRVSLTMCAPMTK